MSITPSYVSDGLRGEWRGESSLPARWPCSYVSLSAVDLLEQKDVRAAALGAFHLVVVGCQAALFKCLLGKVTDEGHIVTFNRSRSKFKQ